VLSRTNFQDHTICTLGSHCSLQVLKGAKDEGFKTLLICEKKRENLYRRFSFIDDFIIVNKFRDILKETVFQKLPNENVYMIPHGTLISNFQIDEIENLDVPFLEINIFSDGRQTES
jgi:5-formaminoimidazole-4-carboxamide-1-(beta)-D-ribofuranosyl 5'-monophosphate synthetase